MTENNFPFTDTEISETAEDGKLLEILKKVPKSQWCYFGEQDWTLLHYATLGNNVEAVILLAKEVDIDTPCYLSTTALTTAAGFENVNVLKVLYALGADVTCRDYGGCDVLDNALIGCYGRSYHNHFAQVNCIQLLISNGMRLEKVKKSLKPRITQEMWRFQEGVVQCRDVIVILLGLKKRQVKQLLRLDRFLIRQVLAVEIWSTRA